MKIITKRVIKPPRVVLYAPEGVGKTTFGTQAPSPLFICTERGTDNFDVPRVNCQTWDEVTEALNYLAAGKHEFKTLVIDTLDWLEALLIKDICEKAEENSIEKVNGGFGKGYIELEQRTREFIMGLDYLIDKGINIFLLAHAKIEKFQDPEITEAMDRWTMKCHKRTAAVYKEWADAVLFANHDRMVVDGKAKGGYTRLVWGTHTAARDAKNRYNIPDLTELDYNKLEPYFQGQK